ncbi:MULTISPECIES: hemerythrin domain-containing protein [Methylomicrobium]|uniref:Hemerythrin HHE cation binding domain-containing protein n=1 Tax=Methylomicrobium album BG8 TaxID=686340 RepID=H8GPR5_METAL|nr:MULTISPECIES: hemerythrin domain-containing protein [Methylomicrobium]EIC28527.1 hemerythrin HHE cation binding domain-containing protein [Methylomicrobium album BG8]
MNQKQRHAAGSAGRGQDAIVLLTRDHERVKELFDEFEMLEAEEGGEDDKLDLVQRICMELTIHTQLEEEIFYPAAIDAIGQLDIMDEALVEHGKAKEQIDQVVSMAPEDDYFDAEVNVLRDMVEHHVQEEEGKMFPKLKKSSIDLAALGEELNLRKQELQMDMGMVEASMRKPQAGRKPMPPQGPMP